MVFCIQHVQMQHLIVQSWRPLEEEIWESVKKKTTTKQSKNKNKNKQIRKKKPIVCVWRTRSVPATFNVTVHIRWVFTKFWLSCTLLLQLNYLFNYSEHELLPLAIWQILSSDSLRLHFIKYIRTSANGHLYNYYFLLSLRWHLWKGSTVHRRGVAGGGGVAEISAGHIFIVRCHVTSKLPMRARAFLGKSFQLYNKWCY